MGRGALELIEGRAGSFEQRSGHRLDEAKGGGVACLGGKKSGARTRIVADGLLIDSSTNRLDKKIIRFSFFNVLGH